MGKTCELCERPLQEGYGGSVCPMCKQEYAALREKATQVETTPQVPVTVPDLPPPAAPVPTAVAVTLQHPEVESIAAYCTGSGAAWLAIGSLQCLAGIAGYYWLILIGAWNIYIATLRLNESGKIRALDPTAPKRWEGTLTGSVVFIIINFFLGAIVGIAGAVLDIIIRGKVLGIRGYSRMELPGSWRRTTPLSVEL
jgi:hypothetical protein